MNNTAAVSISNQNEFDFTGATAGMQEAAANAESAAPGWQDRAVEFIERYVWAHGGPFWVQDVREWAHARGLDMPPHARAWGNAVKRANRLGIVAYLRHEKKPHVGEHATPAALWIAGPALSGASKR